MIAALLLPMIFSFFLNPAAKAVSANPSATCSSNCVVNFTYTGDYYDWVAPITGTYTFQAWGAQGGGDGSLYWGIGGPGGYSTGTASITAGQHLYIYVGQQGIESITSTFNGGGGGNYNSSTVFKNGWTGGGATHIAKVNGLLKNLSSNIPDILLVAGGGGGASGTGGSNWTSTYTVNGGAGGGTTGITGPSSNNETSARPGGTGGTQVAGGTSSGASIAAAFGLGATSNQADTDAIQGGGGGGGFYGGGAGGVAGGAGGGGSSYIGGVSGGSTIAGNASMPNPAGGTMTGNTGHGYVRITYTAPVATSVTLALASQVVQKGSSAQATVTVGQSGKITFFSNGKRIPGCIGRDVTTTYTCTFKPSTRGVLSITATLVPTSGAYSTSFAVPLVFGSSGRLNNR
jgi:hypothetical protein